MLFRSLVVGRGSTVGEKLLADARLPLISATGSCRMGHRVAEATSKRLGRALLELGGNNGVIIMDDADLDLALRAILFGAIGTAGQRCTTIRRIFLQKGVAARMTERLIAAYRQVRIGDPLDESVLMGPLANRAAVEDMMKGLETIRAQGGEILYGGKQLDAPGGCFVEPTIVRSRPDMPIVCDEIFAPILHLIEFETLEEIGRAHV